MESSRIDWIIANERNYYGILGIPRDADERDVRRSYLTLALQLHPDKNINNKRAGEAFRAVGKAYAVLKDKRMRMIYDEGGVDRVHGLDAEDLSIKNLMAALSKLVAAKVLCIVARRAHAVEILRQRHGWVEAFTSWSPADDFACLQKSPREAARRIVRKVFISVFMFFLCVSVGHTFLQFIRRTPNEGSSEEPYRRLSRYNSNDTGATFTIRVLRGGKMTDTVIWRPSSISENDARALVLQWIHEMCPTEKLLLWASRERYNRTATLRVGRKLRAAPSPNRALRRKWAPKGWKVKFQEFFPVTAAEDLYVPLPLCEGVG
ncbi:chaperone DNAJ protein, putative [Trypanosoma cruzi]|nr:chaperone DNAJ protein, putative [Trypanosoma cruzi]